MINQVNSNGDKKKHHLIGKILVEAGLISTAQLEMALTDQSQFFMLRLGEILALRGWLKQETVDFLVDKMNDIVSEDYHLLSQPIGQYFKEAGLLTDQQIDLILEEQQQLGIKFGYLAVLKGFLKEKTLIFFLEQILKADKTSHSKTTVTCPDEDPNINKDQVLNFSHQKQKDILKENNKNLSRNNYQEETMIISSKTGQDYEEIETFTEDKDTIITPIKTITLEEKDTKTIYCGDIAYSTIWIDF